MISLKSEKNHSHTLTTHVCSRDTVSLRYTLAWLKRGIMPKIWLKYVQNKHFILTWVQPMHLCLWQRVNTKWSLQSLSVIPVHMSINKKW